MISLGVFFKGLRLRIRRQKRHKPVPGLRLYEEFDGAVLVEMLEDIIRQVQEDAEELSEALRNLN